MRACIILILAAVIATRLLAQPSPPTGFSGIVRYQSGEPALGVHVIPFTGTFYQPDDYNHHEALTGNNGRYEIAPPQKVSEFHFGMVFTTNCILAQDLEHGLAAFKWVPEEQTNIDLTLEPGIVLSGSVQDSEGTPLAGAEIQLELDFVSTEFLPLMRPPFRADEKGQFHIPALPRGIDYSVTIDAKGYGSQHGRAEAQNTQKEKYEFPTFVLKTADRKLAGRVVDNEGRPLAGTKLSVYGPDQPSKNETTTDHDGLFRFDNICEGPFQISAFYSEPGKPTSFLSSGGGLEFKSADTNILIILR